MEEYEDGLKHFPSSKDVFKDKFVNNPLYKMRQNFASSSPFGNRSILYENRCGAFNSLPIDRNVKVDKLISALKNGIKDKKYFFDSKSFFNPISHQNGMLVVAEPYSKPNYLYKQDGVMRESYLKVQLNTRICSLDPDLGYRINLDPTGQKVSFKVIVYYSETKQYRKKAKDTTEKNDFRISNKYRAIIFDGRDIQTFEYIYFQLGGTSSIRKHIRIALDEAFKNSKSPSELNWFYSIAPDYYIKSIHKGMLWNNFLTLLKYDSEGRLSLLYDSSNAMINVLKGISNQVDGKFFLFKKFNDDPIEVKKIYEHLQGTSEFNKEKMANKTVFSSILTAISDANLDQILTTDSSKPPKWGERDKTHISFKIGKGHKVDSNVFVDDAEAGKFNLTQEVLVKADDPDPYFSQGLEEASGLRHITSDTYSSDGQITHTLHPLDIVTLELEGEFGEPFFMTVPAIYVKDMAYHREWGEIMQFVRLSVNFLMIIVATATIASGAGLLLTTLAWIDLGLAFFDIAVQLFEEELRKTEWGRKFLEIWDTIYTIGGIVTGAPLLGQLLVNGTKALARITNAEAKIKLAAMLKAALLKTNNFPKYLSGKFEIIVDLLERIKTGFKYPQLVSIAGKLQKLQKEGVLIIKSVTKIDGKIVKKYVLIYKDAIIAEGKTGAELRQAIKKFFGPNGKVMEETLEAAAKKAKRKSYFIKRRIEMQADDFKDVRSGGVYRPHEIESFIELELKYDGISRAALENEAGDIIMETGELAGKSLDPLGLAEGAIEPWERSFNKQFKDFKRSINRHFEKIHAPKSGLPPLDIVVIDFKYMDEINSTLKQKVLDYIESPTFDYKQYINEKYLIKLNF